MKTLHSILFIIYFSSNSLYSQIPDAYGVFPKYRDAKIKSITQYQIHYSDTLPNDTLKFQKVSFNKSGQLTKREFDFDRKYGRRIIEYAYNNQNLCYRIDSTGMFSYGYGSSGPDTNYFQKEEIYQFFDITMRIYRSRSTYDNWQSYTETQYLYDSVGKLIIENSIQIAPWLDKYLTMKTEYHYFLDFILESIGFADNKMFSKTYFKYELFE